MKLRHRGISEKVRKSGGCSDLAEREQGVYSGSDTPETTGRE